MKPVFRGALLVAIAIGAGAAGPDLSCSSDDTKETVGQIVGRAILGDLSTDRAAKISLAGGLTAIRTVSAADTKHVCKAVLDVHATYNGPTQAEATARRSDAMKAAEAGGHDALRAYYQTPEGAAELKSFTVAMRGIDQGVLDAGSAESKASQFRGEINYTVEATDDGKAFVTVLPNQP